MEQYPHPLHQRLHMTAADLALLQSQQAAQHTRTGEGMLQVQPIETLHDREVGVRHRARQVINAAAADLQNFRLPGDRQIVLTVNHRFALSNPALLSAPSKNVLQRQLPDFGVERLHVDCWLLRSGVPDTECVGCLALQLSLPRRDLIGGGRRTARQAAQRSARH